MTTKSKLRLATTAVGIFLILSGPAFAQHTFNRDDGTFSYPAAGDVTFTQSGTGAVAQTANSKLLSQPADIKADFGATCNGIADDTAAIQAALNANKQVRLPANSVCMATSITVNSQNFDLNGSTLRAAAGIGHNPLVFMTGWAAMVHNGQLDDSYNYMKTSTTLSAPASPTDTTLHLTSSTSFVAGDVIAVALDSGIHHVSKVTNVVGNDVTIYDAVPYSVTAAAVAGGGTGYANGNVLTVAGGSGPPATLVVTSNSGGVITGVSVSAPGLYATAPTNAVSVTGGAGSGATFNLTFAGASGAAVVETARGLLVIDKIRHSTAKDLRLINASIGIEVKGTGTGIAPSYGTSLNHIENVTGTTLSMVGIYHDINASVISYNNVKLYGTYTPFGYVGMYRNVDGTLTFASGGNFLYDVEMLQFETGYLMHESQLDVINGCVADTLSYYGMIFRGATQTTRLNSCYVGYIGTGGSKGVGVIVYGSSYDIIMDGLQTKYNATDIFIESGSELTVPDSSWGPSKILAGSGNLGLAENLVYGGTSLGGAPGRESLRVTNPAQNSNRYEVTGGDYPVIKSNGTSTNVDVSITSKGAGNINFFTGGPTGGGSKNQVTIKHVANSNRAVRLQGSNGANPAIDTTAGDLALGSPHIILGNALSPTIASGACGAGTNGVVVTGNDHRFNISIGAAATTSCQITFDAAWSYIPTHCSATPMNAAAAAWGTNGLYQSAISTTSVTFTGAALASTDWGFHCF